MTNWPGAAPLGDLGGAERKDVVVGRQPGVGEDLGGDVKRHRPASISPTRLAAAGDRGSDV